MTYFASITRTVSVSALIALSTLPTSAYAGKHTLAVAAIAQAKGKIDAGDKVNAGSQAPELQAQARASLSSAQDLLSKGHKDEAISAARHASEFADQAIVSAENSRTASERDRRHDAQDSAAMAVQAASDANVRTSIAQQATANASALTDEANRRTALAQQATVDANARADALRAAAPIAAAPATTTTTTVAMVQDNPAPRSHATVRPTAHRTRRNRHVAPRQIHRSMTTVTTTHS